MREKKNIFFTEVKGAQGIPKVLLEGVNKSFGEKNHIGNRN